MPVDDHGPDGRPDGVPTLRRYLQALWRRKWVALAPVVVILAVTLVATLRQQEVFEASADVLINRQEAATTSVIGQTPALDDADRAMETQVRLARVPLVIERTLAATGLADRTSRNALLGSSSVFPLADILRFTVSDDDPARAARLASAYARQFVRYRRELDTLGFAGTLRALRGEMSRLEAAGDVDSPRYEQLADREQQFELLRALRTSNVSVVRMDGAADADKVAPRPRRNVAVAIGAGLVVGLILVFLFETLTTRPRSEDDFEALLGMQFLARLTAARRDSSLVVDEALGPEADAVHTLRTNLELANAAVGARTIMITSPHADEGKSVAAAQLAVALARAGRRVTLVDLDLRQSSLTELFGLGDRVGVTSLARGECGLNDALVVVPLDGDMANGAPDSNGRRELGALLELVGAGPYRGHPAELLSSKALAELLTELERRTDMVLVDVPPVLEAPDASAVAAHVDGLLLVVSSRTARGPTLADVRRSVETWPVAKLGFALTDGGGKSLSVRQLRRPDQTAPPSVVESERVA